MSQNRNLLNSVELKKPSDNIFDLSYDHKLSANMGDLVPVHFQEIIPGDNITMSCETMIRLAPMLAPIMHRVDVTVHFFFVPNRLIWPSWEEFMSWDNTPGAPAVPYFENFVTPKGSLFDYMGLPILDAPGVFIDIPINAMPFAAYNKVFNEYYRDENLVPALVDELSDGLNSEGDYAYVRKRAWEHDYFTACLPWPQKGDPVAIPLGDVKLKTGPFAQPGVFVALDGVSVPTGDVRNDTISAITGASVDTGPIQEHVVYDPNNSLTVASTTINDLRKAFRLQEFLERDALGGTRYTEIIRAHFGVTSSDARLQRPEYLGGVKAPVVISEVLQTAESAGTPQGNMSGHGISVGTGRGFSRFFEEHGTLLGILSVLPKTAYQQGIPRFFRKFDKYDWYWPEFAHIGEQAVPHSEIYYTTGGAPNQVFGYNPRYSEYKYIANQVSGDFTDQLSYWHMGRIFSAPPFLNGTFINSDPTHRIFANTTPTDDKLYIHVFHRIKARRRMPFYGSPSF